MSEKKPASRSTAKTSQQAQGQTPRSGQGMTEKTAATPRGTARSSVASTTPPAGSGATSAAADAATTSTEVGKGTDRAAGAVATADRESLQQTPDAPGPGGSNQAGDREERIRRRAYELWEAEGWPHGREQDHWAQAERELMGMGGDRVTDVGADQDRSGVVAAPSAMNQPGASEKLDGTPSALRTAGRSRDEG